MQTKVSKNIDIHLHYVQMGASNINSTNISDNVQGTVLNTETDYLRKSTELTMQYYSVFI